MIRFLFRFLGLLLLALSFILLVYDGTKWIADQNLELQHCRFDLGEYSPKFSFRAAAACRARRRAVVLARLCKALFY